MTDASGPAKNHHNTNKNPEEEKNIAIQQNNFPLDIFDPSFRQHCHYTRLTILLVSSCKGERFAMLIL